ncbi:hypothetical protein N9937_01755 [bacterium]|nr:hypothetical protein [bacterium]
MSTTATAPKYTAATFTTFEDNLAAALSTCGVPFHPDYQGGRGNISILSKGGTKEGWYFAQQNAAGATATEIREAWDDPDAAARFSELVNTVEGQLGSDLRKAYTGAVVCWQRNFAQNRARLLEIKNGRAKPEQLIDIERGGHHWLFNKSNDKFRKAHGIR